MNRNEVFGKRGTKIHYDVEVIIRRATNEHFLNKESCTFRNIYDRVIDRIIEENKRRDKADTLTYPSISTIRKRILSITNHEIGAKNKIDKLKRGASYPLQRVMVDHTVLDVMVVDDENAVAIGKPIIAMIVEEFSGYPLGYYISFEMPSYLTVMQALRHAISPKHYTKEKYPEIVNNWDAYGVPRTLVIDNGKEFLSNSLKDSCFKLGIAIEHRPKAKPTYKWELERFFRSITQHLTENNKGQLFSENGDKKEDKPLRREGTIGLNQLHELLHLGLIDFYAQQFNKEIGGIPSKIWNQLKPLQVEPTFESTRALLPTSKGITQRKGIRFLHLYYQSRELQVLHFKPSKDNRVLFHYNPDDLSVIYVHDKSQKKFLVVPCINLEYSKGLNEHVHRLHLSILKRERKVEVQALMTAKEKMLRIIEEAQGKPISNLEIFQKIYKITCLYGTLNE